MKYKVLCGASIVLLLFILLSCNSDANTVKKAKEFVKTNESKYLEVFKYCIEDSIDSLDLINVRDERILKMSKALNLTDVVIQKDSVVDNPINIVTNSDSIVIFVPANQSIYIRDYFIYDFSNRERKLDTTNYPKAGFYCWPIIDRWYYIQQGFD